MKDGRDGSSRRGTASGLPGADADLIAIQALTFIAGDPEQADRFFAASGLQPSELRRAAADPGFLLGVMDYLLTDEALLVGFAQSMGIEPEAVVRAHAGMADRR